MVLVLSVGFDRMVAALPVLVGFHRLRLVSHRSSRAKFARRRFLSRHESLWRPVTRLHERTRLTGGDRKGNVIDAPDDLS
jgi:hypothetical protein